MGKIVNEFYKNFSNVFNYNFAVEEQLDTASKCWHDVVDVLINNFIKSKKIRFK